MAGGRFRRAFRLAARPPSVGQDVDDEIAIHLEQLTDWLIERGWAPEAARDEARRRFGDLDRFRRELRVIDGTVRRRQALGDWLSGWLQDLRYAVRGLRRSPAYAAVVVGTLGVALGANATMFGVVDRLLLRPPPGIGHPDEVRRITVARFDRDLNGVGEAWDAISYPSFAGLRDGSGEAFAGVAARMGGTVSVGLGSEARQGRAVFASGQYFGMLEVRPALGRLFDEVDDALPAGRPVVVLAHTFWSTAYGGDSSLVGRSLLLSGVPFEVIGVAPRGFNGVNPDPIDLWVPLSTAARLFYSNDDWRTNTGHQFLNAIVRLRPGRGEVEAMDGARRGYQQANAGAGDFEGKAEPRFTSLLEREDAGPERVAGWLYGVTIVVLLIAAANIANVVLARGLARRNETAVRQALGVSRGRLLRQHLVETVVVLALGLVLGLLVTQWGGVAVRRLLLARTAWDSSPVNVRVLLVTAGAAIVAAFLASLWPLLRSARVDVVRTLHGAGRSTGGPGPGVRGGLLLVQTTLCTALIVLAGLFLRSMDAIRSLDLGIDPRGVALVSVDLQGLGATQDEIATFFQRAAERVRALPGVAAAGLSFGAPFLGNQGSGIRVPGRDSIPRLPGGGPYFFPVSPGAIEAFGIRVVDGRPFDDGDRAGTPPVTLVSETMARTLWPGERAIGKCFYVRPDETSCLEIVGVVSDLHRQGLDEAAFMLYFRVLEQLPERIPARHLVVRTDREAEGIERSIRQALAESRAELPFVRIAWYSDILSAHARPWSLGATLFSIFGGLSLVIAGIGLYGVIAFAVTQRTRELGLRAALGASPRRLLRGVVLRGVGLASLGIALGLGVALAAGSRMQALLFHTDAREPVVLGAAVVVVVVVSALATWIPARRAARVDPMAVLRVE
ncbi:MAG: ADOP family duplicated permease [Gemmatimonadales bacterium]